jgi:hypothetical protein
MSTRGLLGVRFTDLEGKKQFHGCYNHFDSYPSGLGEEVVEFVQKVLHHPITIEQMYKNAQKVEWVDEDKKPTKKQLTNLVKAGFCIKSERLEDIRNSGLSCCIIEGASTRTKQNENWYWTLRDYQGFKTFEAIFKGIPYLVEYTSFIRCPTCEYAYVLDLDRQVLEFYKGWQIVYGHLNQYIEINERDDGSHYESNIYKDKEGRRYSYAPCRKIGEKPFSDLEGWKKFFPDHKFD